MPSFPRLLRSRALVTSLFLLCSCQAGLGNTALLPCEQIAQVITKTEEFSLRSGRAGSEYRAEKIEVLANTLAELKIEDEVLTGYRDRLIELYEHSSDLWRQEAAFVAVDGTITAENSDYVAYQQVSRQQAAITIAVQEQHNAMNTHCAKLAS